MGAHPQTEAELLEAVKREVTDGESPIEVCFIFHNFHGVQASEQEQEEDHHVLKIHSVLSYVLLLNPLWASPIL